MIHKILSLKSQKLQTDAMPKTPDDIHAELLMICGALHDIAELSRQENVRNHVKTVQQKLEKLTLDRITAYEQRRPKSQNTKIRKITTSAN